MEIRNSFVYFKYDDFVKSRFFPVFVIPAEAGIQLNQAVLDFRPRGSDGLSGFFTGSSNIADGTTRDLSVNY
jgi:hypothetical protein